jgi:hypothetical protein
MLIVKTPGGKLLKKGGSIDAIQRFAKRHAKRTGRVVEVLWQDGAAPEKGLYLQARFYPDGTIEEP